MISTQKPKKNPNSRFGGLYPRVSQLFGSWSGSSVCLILLSSASVRARCVQLDRSTRTFVRVPRSFVCLYTKTMPPGEKNALGVPRVPPVYHLDSRVLVHLDRPWAVVLSRKIVPCTACTTKKTLVLTIITLLYFTFKIQIPSKVLVHLVHRHLIPYSVTLLRVPLLLKCWYTPLANQL